MRGRIETKRGENEIKESDKYFILLRLLTKTKSIFKFG